MQRFIVSVGGLMAVRGLVSWRLAIPADSYLNFVSIINVTATQFAKLKKLTTSPAIEFSKILLST